MSMSTTPSSQPVIELREDVLFPRYIENYVHTIYKDDSLRRSCSDQWCFTSHPEIGGVTNVINHAYFFEGGLPERQELVRKAEQEHPEWKSAEDSLAPFIQSQQSSLFVEASLVKATNLVGMAGQLQHSQTPRDEPWNDKTVLEFRRYYLKLGYDTVPKFLKLYGAGLPSKLSAPGTDPSTSLMTVLYSEVGRLNEVIEIWDHGDGVEAMETSRVAARGATEWRNAIAGIAKLAIEFRCTIHKPLI